MRPSGCGGTGSALKESGAAKLQETGRRLNDRAENSHFPFRRRERAMIRFRRAKTLQKFAAVHGTVHNHFAHECTSSPAKAAKNDARLPWLSGGPSWNKTRTSLPLLRLDGNELLLN